MPHLLDLFEPQRKECRDSPHPDIASTGHCIKWVVDPMPPNKLRSM